MDEKRDNPQTIDNKIHSGSERERWLYANPEAMAMVKRGLEESARGEAVHLGDFTRYIDDTDENDENDEND